MKDKMKKFRAIFGVAVLASSLFLGVASGCSSSEEEKESTDDTQVTVEDEKPIKNGSFEFYTDNDGLYPISKPDSWSGNYSVNSSASMSGIINTNYERWNYITDTELPDKLKENDALASDDENRKDYNGALADDLPYANPHTAIETDKPAEGSDAKKYIANPFTPNFSYDVDGEGKVTTYHYKGEDIAADKTYKNDDGKLCYKDADDKEIIIESSVLMIHNYRKNYYSGTEYYYRSSSSYTLEPNTAAEFSVWVKTDELWYDGDNNKRTKVDSEYGAYIKVDTEVGGHSLDSFKIKNIDTQFILKNNSEKADPTVDLAATDYKNVLITDEYNGWIKYTIFVESSSYADTKVTFTLGLGEGNAYPVEGYAFFDDLQLVNETKYLNVGAMEKAVDERFTSSQNAAEQKLVSVASRKGPAENAATPFKWLTRENTTCYPLAPKANMEFRADVTTRVTQTSAGNSATEEIKDTHNCLDTTYFIDFTGDGTSENLAYGTDYILKGGLTVENNESGSFICSDYDTTEASADPTAPRPDPTRKYLNPHDLPLAVSPTEYNSIVPKALRDNNKINISDDLIDLFRVGKNWTADNYPAFKFTKTLNDNVASAYNLPGVSGDDGEYTFLMFSSRGASYEMHIANPNGEGGSDAFKVENKQYGMFSFWMKTSNMDGKTAATVTVYDANDPDNNSSFTVDSTKVGKVKIGDNEDVYDGWVRCYVRVDNTSDKAQYYKIKVNFGKTTVENTSISDYKAGWVAVSNISYMNFDEDLYEYSSNLSRLATLSFTETTPVSGTPFDSELGDKNLIQESLANSANYMGVNGNSVRVGGTNSTEQFLTANANPLAGLMSKEYLENYVEIYNGLTAEEKNKNWFKVYESCLVYDGSELDVDKTWENMTGNKYTVQPLVIVNGLRPEASATNIVNYGYVGNVKSVGKSSYTPVSVKVKVSEGAVANIYLVAEDNSVLSYSTPEYTFWYNDDGDILKKEPKKNATLEEKKANIAYTLRNDGLYEDSKGELYANFFNLEKYYDVYEKEFSSCALFDSEGKSVTFDRQNGQGKIYYADAQLKSYAPHYLIAKTAEGNKKIYKYASGTAEQGNLRYYYIENGTANEQKIVKCIDPAVAERRDSGSNTELYFTIDCRTAASPDYALRDKWITVTFYLHGGNIDNKYKLELWSGERDRETTENVANNSYVMFDYSPITSVSSDNYNGLLNEYTDKIIKAYQNAYDDELESNDLSIADLEKLFLDKGLTLITKYDYKVGYYTYSLYDSSAYVPFNAETEDELTGYSYSFSDYDEAVTYLVINDDSNGTKSMFVDYSVIDKEVETTGNKTDETDGEGEEEEESDENTSSTNFWLLAASIILVVAIIIAMIAILLRNVWKKRGPKKSANKNSYNFTKNKRYVKKYVKANGEAPEISEGGLDESLLSDATVEVPAEEPVEETAADEVTEEAPVEETPEEVAEETAAEESKADKATEEAAEEAPAEDTPAEEGKADEKPEEVAEEAPAEDTPAEESKADEKPEDDDKKE